MLFRPVLTLTLCYPKPNPNPKPILSYGKGFKSGLRIGLGLEFGLSVRVRGSAVEVRARMKVWG